MWMCIVPGLILAAWQWYHEQHQEHRYCPMFRAEAALVPGILAGGERAMSDECAIHSEWELMPMPPERAQLPVGRWFSAADMDSIRQGFLPRDMDDRWLMFFAHNRLHVHQSWVGTCIYIAHFQPQGEQFVLVSAEVNRNDAQYAEKDDAYDRKKLLFLIDVLLLGHRVPVPEGAYGYVPPEVQELERWKAVGQQRTPPHTPDSSRPTGSDT
jgi:hypothetical protein